MCSLGPPPAPSRGLHKYYDNDDVIADYSQELKDYGSFEADQRRSYRSSDSPTSLRNGRYTSPGTHDDVFLERSDSKSQLDWDNNSRSGYKSSDDRTSSRGGQHGHSPSDGDRSRGGGMSRSRTKSISPVRRRYSKEHKVLSPGLPSSRDYSRHDDRAARHNSLESPDRDRYSSRTSSDVSRSWTHGGAGDCIKPRTVANNIEGDSSVVTDRNRLLRTSDSGSASRRGGTLSSEGSRRHADKDASRTNTVRSVVNTTPSWRFDSDYKHSSRGGDHAAEPFIVDANHIEMALQKLRSETIEVASDSTSPRSKSPRAGSDADESASGSHTDRPASKGSDDMSHLEKEKSHLLNMLKELEDYSSGGSEIEGLDEESRAVLRRLHRQRDLEIGDNDSDVSNTDAKHGTSVDGAAPLPATPARVLENDITKLSGELRSAHSRSHTSSARRLSETSRRSSVNSDTKKRRLSMENQVGPVMTSSLDAEDNIIDLIGSSPPAEIPAEFTRRHRSSSEITPTVLGDRGVKPRRSYRPRESADSADSGAEDTHSTTAAKTATSCQTSDHGSTIRPEVPVSSSGTFPAAVHRTHSLDDVSSTSRRASTSGPSRKSSGGDHQPCIIPDSPITTRGPDIRPPTEPRTVSLTTTAGGRTIMDLPLPRFGYEIQSLRHPAATAAEHTTCSSSASIRVETTMAHMAASSMSVKTEVAPFSPGLLSPTLSPPATRLDTFASTSVSMPASTTVSAQPVTVKSENEPQLSTDTVNSDAAEKETVSVDTATVKTEDLASEVDKQIASDVDASSACDSAAMKVEVKLELEAEEIPVVISGKEVGAVTVPVSAAVKEEATSVAVSDSDVSDLLSPGSPPDAVSLEDRIRALDEKLNQIQKTTPRHLTSSDSPGGLLTSAFDYSRFIRRRKPPTTPTTGAECSAANEPSEYVKSLLSRTSIFDQDSRRLEQLHSKFDASVSVAGSGLGDSGSSSLVSRMRYAGRLPPHDLTLQLPPSSSSLPLSPYPSSSVSGYRPSDLSVPLSSPGSSYCSRAPGLVTPPPSSWYASTMSIVTTASGWTSTWAGPSTLLSPAVPVASTPDSAAVRSSSYLPYVMPQTPSVVSTSAPPTDPRRAPRSADMFNSPLSVRRQDSSHSTDMSSDTSALNSSTRRELDMSTVPSKPKEMVSPPVSILKKTSVSSMPKDEPVVATTKSSETPQSSSDVSSTGLKRSAEAAFGKELTSSTPNKIVARTPKTVPPPSTVSETESHSSTSKVSESDSQKAQTSGVKRPEPAKKPVQSKPSTSKVDEKKTDHGTSGTTTSGRKVSSEDVTKSGSSVKPQNKPHSSSSSTSTSSVSTASKSHTHRDSKPSNSDSLRHTSGSKESSGANSDLADKHSSSHTSAGSGKPKISHSTSKELTTKDRPVDDRDKLATSDEKDSAAGKEKSTSHSSSKHHQAEHRHSDKSSRDGKPDDSSKTSKVSVPSSTSKSAPKPAARDPAKPDKNLHSKPKTETNIVIKKESLEFVKKDGAGHPKPSSSNKSERDHKSEKDETSRDKGSLSNMQTKPLKKPGADSVPKSKSSAPSTKPPSSVPTKLKHGEKSSSDRKSDGKKPETSQPEKSKKPQSATSDKNKVAKKKMEKRPEEKREVNA